MTNAPETRKTHVIRIFGTNRDGDVLSDIWVDVERTDSFKAVLAGESGVNYQGRITRLKWMDDPNGDDYEEDGNPARKLKTLKVCDPSSNDDLSDPDEWVPVPVIITMRAVSSYNNYQGTKLKFRNDPDDPETSETRKVDQRRIVHYDTNIDDGAQAAADSGQKVYVVSGDQYQRDDSTKDDGQYVEVEVITHTKARHNIVQQPGPPSKPGEAFAGDQGRQINYLNQYLIDESDPAQLTETGESGINPPYRLDPFQNIINVNFGVYDNRVVFAIDNDGSVGGRTPSVHVSKNGWDWIGLGGLGAYTGDDSVTFINLGGYRRDIKKFVVSGTNGTFASHSNIDMVSDDGEAWAHQGADVDPTLLYAYSKKASSRSASGYVWRVANDPVRDTDSIWDKVDEKRYLNPNYARVGGSVIQRCANTAAKEDDDGQQWETVLSAGGAYVEFGPITVVKGSDPGDVATVVCVAGTPNGEPRKFAIISSRDGNTFTERFSGPPVVNGGSDIVTFYSGRAAIPGK